MVGCAGAVTYILPPTVTPKFLRGYSAATPGSRQVLHSPHVNDTSSYQRLKEISEARRDLIIKSAALSATPNDAGAYAEVEAAIERLEVLKDSSVAYAAQRALTKRTAPSPWVSTKEPVTKADTPTVQDAITDAFKRGNGDHA